MERRSSTTKRNGIPQCWPGRTVDNVSDLVKVIEQLAKTATDTEHTSRHVSLNRVNRQRLSGNISASTRTGNETAT